MDNMTEATKFCKFCGEKIPVSAVMCTKCGRQVEELKSAEQPSQTPNIVINNANTNTNTNTNTNGGFVGGKMKNKWVALVLCILFGYFGIHRFYEGKIGSGLLYMFTFGLLGIGWAVDTIALIFKPTYYYV